MEQLFHPITINKSIILEAKYINNKLDDFILKKVKDEIEGRCIKDGYVKPNSVKILKRSLGSTQQSHFTGTILYHLLLSIEICNPLQGAVIEAQVVNTSKMGILAGVPYEEVSPLNILLAREHHIDNQDFLNLKQKDLIKIKIIGRRFEQGENHISIIGILHDSSLDKEESNSDVN